MKSIKPGRGPSFMGGIASAAIAVFGIFWTVMAVSMGAPALFPVFGVIFVILGAVQAVYNFKNATSQNRYSAFDITDSREEEDPLNARFGRQEPEPWEQAERSENGGFCPYCGAEVRRDHAFCKECGKKIT